jgi:hypothetical protein
MSFEIAPNSNDDGRAMNLGGRMNVTNRISRAANLLVAYLAIAGNPLPAQTAAASASLHGSVTDPNGHPIPNAAIRCVRQPRYVTVGALSAFGQMGNKLVLAPGEILLNATAQADANGTFQIASLPAGDYLVCAYASGYLDSCKWGLARSAPGLAVAETRNLNSIALIPAAVVTVQVSDPLGLLPTKLNPAMDPGLIVGVKRPLGTFLPSAPAVSTGGRTYQLSVPFATPLTIWVYSRTLALADAQNTTLSPGGAGIALEVASGSKPAPITIRVTGRK